MAANIIAIQADQLTALCLAAYGKPYAKTPNMDRIAASGTTFVNAYCNSPVCGPSRASMMTGRLPSDVGVFDNAGEFASSEPTYAHYLRTQGYKTTLVGKMHFVGPDQLHGFERRLTTDIYPSDFGWTADWSQVDEPYSPSHMSLLGVVEAGVCERSLQIDYDDLVSFQAEQEIYDCARSKDDRPFFLHVSYTHPHNPFVTTKEYWDLYDDEDVPTPEVPFILYDERDAWAQRYFLTIRQDEFDVTDEQLQTARRAYFAMVSYFDAQIGRLLEALERTGQLEDTYVFVFSDHGEMIGERGMWFKFNPFEGSMRIPLMAMGPGLKKGHREEAVTSLVDLLPTFTSIASDGEFTDFAAPIDGRDLRNLPEAGTDDDLIYAEFLGEGVNAPALMVRKANLKYIHCRTDPPLMFDLANDPLELNNIAATSLQAPAMKKLVDERWNEEQLEKDTIASQKARLFVQEAMKHGEFPSWDYTPPFDASRAFVRGAIDPSTTATKARRRFPFVETTKPQNPRT